MTSQDQHQDNLMQRMMTAEEKPLSKVMKTDGSAEEDSEVAAGKLSDHYSQMLLTQRQDHHNHDASEPVPEIENTSSECGHRDILSDLQEVSQIASGKLSDREIQILLTQRQVHNNHRASEPVPEMGNTNPEHSHHDILSDLQGEPQIASGKSSDHEIQILLTQCQGHNDHRASEQVPEIENTIPEHGHREIIPDSQGESQVVAGESSDRIIQIPLTQCQAHDHHGLSVSTQEIEDTNTEHGHREIRSGLQGESQGIAGKSYNRYIQMLLTKHQAYHHHGASALTQDDNAANAEHHHHEITPAVQASSGMLVMLNLAVRICMFGFKADQSSSQPTRSLPPRAFVRT